MNRVLMVVVMTILVPQAPAQASEPQDGTVDLRMVPILFVTDEEKITSLESRHPNHEKTTVLSESPAIVVHEHSDCREFHQAVEAVTRQSVILTSGSPTPDQRGLFRISTSRYDLFCAKKNDPILLLESRWGQGNRVDYYRHRLMAWKSGASFSGDEVRFHGYPTFSVHHSKEFNSIRINYFADNDCGDCAIAECFEISSGYSLSVQILSCEDDEAH